MPGQTFWRRCRRRWSVAAMAAAETANSHRSGGEAARGEHTGTRQRGRGGGGLQWRRQAGRGVCPGGGVAGQHSTAGTMRPRRINDDWQLRPPPAGPEDGFLRWNCFWHCARRPDLASVGPTHHDSLGHWKKPYRAAGPPSRHARAVRLRRFRNCRFAQGIENRNHPPILKRARPLTRSKMRWRHRLLFELERHEDEPTRLRCPSRRSKSWRTGRRSRRSPTTARLPSRPVSCQRRTGSPFERWRRPSAFRSSRRRRATPV